MNKTIVLLLTVIFFGNVLFSAYAEAETFCTITATNDLGVTVELKDVDCDGIPDKSCTDCSPPYLVDNCLIKPNGLLMGSCIGGTKAGESCTADNDCGENSLCSMGQEDADNDTIGDVCDYCDGSGQYDTDEDGICEKDDNCPGINNPDQKDSDGDGNGNLCSNRIEKFAPVKSFTGNWYEIGRQVGRTFPDNIIEFGNVMGMVLLYNGPGNGWTPQTFYDATLEWIPESVQQHMEGMTMGIMEVSPISYATAWDLVLTQNMAIELLNMAKNISPIPTPEVLACTSFGVTSPAGSFLAHNTDAQSTGKSTAAIMYWKPTNGDFAYLTMDPPGWADVAFGLNEKGIGVTMNAGNPNTAAAMGMYPNFLIRYSMEHASTLEEAVGMFENHLASGNTFGPTGVIIHYMDFNQNTMAKIQLRSEAIEVTYGQQSTSGATYIGSANHFVNDFSPDSEYYYESSDERYNRLMVLMEQIQTFDLNACWSVLSDTNGGEPNNNTISRKGTFATSSTVFGTIFTPDGLYYAMGMPHAYLDEYETAQFLPLNFEYDIDLEDYNLSIWDFSGTYTESRDGMTLSYILAQDLKGKLTGSGTFDYSSDEIAMSIPVEIKGKVKGKNSIVTLKYKVKGKDAEGNKIQNNLMLALDESILSLVGTEKIKVCQNGAGCEKTEASVSLDVPDGMTGEAELEIAAELDENGKKLEGIAELTLSNGDEYPLYVKGKYNSNKMETQFQIKGVDENTKGIKIKLKIDEGSDAATFIRGKALGQQLKY